MRTPRFREVRYVEEYSPMKRGLKGRPCSTPCPEVSVEEYSPMKRGLKAVLPLDLAFRLVTVEEYSPMKRGLKAEIQSPSTTGTTR